MSVFDAFPTTEPVDAVVLARIERAGAGKVFRAVDELLPFLPPTSVAAYGEAAARALTAVVSRTTPEEIAAFDAWFRERTYAGPYWPIWDHIRAKPVAQWLRVYPVVLKVATCSPNGYARERAVELLAETVNDGSELPFLLLRLNDWVPPIRFIAAKAVKARLTQEHDHAWVRCLGLLRRVQVGGRSDHGWLARPVEALLQAETSRGALASGLESTSVEVRRACTRLAIGLVGTTDLLRRALTDADPITSGSASAALCRILQGEPLRDVLEVMRKGNATARALALETTCACFPESAESYLRDALLDPATHVREVARFQWKKTSENMSRIPAIDFAAFYRTNIVEHGGPRFVTALRGLAEVGTMEDIPAFRAYAQDPRARVREAAILGLGRIDGAKHIDLLEQGMRDTNLRVVKAAHRFARLYLGKGAVSKLPRRG